MTKDIQTRVRVMSEELINKLYDRSLQPDALLNNADVIVHLEVARQIAQLTEEMHRLTKTLEEG